MDEVVQEAVVWGGKFLGRQRVLAFLYLMVLKLRRPYDHFDDVDAQPERRCARPEQVSFKLRVRVTIPASDSNW